MPTSNSKRVLLEETEPSIVPVVELPYDSEEHTGGSKVRMFSILLILIVAAGFISWKIHANLSSNDVAGSASGGRQPASGERAIPVVVTAVQQRSMPVYLTALGTVAAYYSVTIKSRVDGQLTAVDVREGQNVRKGQLLAQIDSGPYAAALAEAEGQLAKDKAAAAYATIEADRYTSLFNAGVVSQDSQQTFAASAGQLAGAMQADKASIQAAKVNLDYTRITSPIDGMVGLRLVDPGNIVHAADATGLMLVTQLQPVSVIFTLPEDQLPQVRQPLLKGSKLSVEAYDRSQTTLLATGKLLTMDNQIDTSTGTDKVKAIFDNKDSALFPNQFVNVRLILQQRPDAIVIPSSAVQTGSQGNFVFVVKKGDPPKSGTSAPKADTTASASKHKRSGDPASDGILNGASAAEKGGDSGGLKTNFYAELRPITVDLIEGSQVIVRNGLAAGEQVVIDGMEKLKNGSRVAPAGDSSKAVRKVASDGSASPDKPKGAADEGAVPHQRHSHGQQP